MTSLAIVLACVAGLGILYLVLERFPPISNRGERRLLIFTVACWVFLVAGSLIIDGEIPYALLGVGVAALAYFLLDRRGKARQQA